MFFLSLSRFFWGAAFLAVAVVLPQFFFPFFSSKFLLFELSVELSIIFFLLAFVFCRGGELVREFTYAFNKFASLPLVWALTAFAFFFIIAGAVGVDPLVSFWSNFERGEGGWLMIHLYAFFWLFLLLFRSALLRRKIVWLAIFGALFATAGYAFLVLLRPGGFSFEFGGRFWGSLGNPAYLSSYLLFIFFYVAYLWFDSPHVNFDVRTSRAVLKKIFLLAAAGIFTYSFVAAETRGSFLALAVGVLAFIIYTTADRDYVQNKKNLRKVFLAVLFIFVVASSFLFYFRDSEFVGRLPGRRFLELSLSERSFLTRVWVWQSAWRGFLEKPIFGWGPGNFLAVFDKYFDTRHFLGQGTASETWFDRAHSVVFDYLAETGIVGFLGYVSVFVAFYWMFFMARRRYLAKPKQAAYGSSGSGVLKQALFFSMLVAYLVNGLVFFDTFPVYLNLFFFLGLFIFDFYSPPRQNQQFSVTSCSVPEGFTYQVGVSTSRFNSRGINKEKVVKIFYLFVAAAILLGMFCGTLQPIRASLFMRRSFDDLTGQILITDMKDRFSAIAERATVVGETEALLRLISAADLAVKSGVSPNVARDLVFWSETYSEPFLLKHKTYPDTRVLFALATLYFDAGSATGDGAYFKKSEAFYLSGLNFAPKRPQFLYGLMNLYAKEGRNVEARAIGEKIITYWPFDSATRTFVEALK